MNWKKIFISLAVFALGAAALAVGAFYAIDMLRIILGLKPVLLKAPQDITKILLPAGEEAMGEEEEGKNGINMPLKLPEGFSVSIFAKDLGAQRVMMWGPDGNLWTSIPSQGKVVALRDANGDGFAEEAVTVLDGLNRPHGMASRCDGPRCTIYIAESHQVAAYEYERGVLLKSKKKVADLPDGGRHFTRMIMFILHSPEFCQTKFGRVSKQNTLLLSVHRATCAMKKMSGGRKYWHLMFAARCEFATGLRNQHSWRFTR